MIYSTSRRFGRRTFAVAAAATAVGVFGIVKSPSKAAQFEFKCATSQPLDQPSGARLAQMWASIGEESGGRIHTEFYPNGMLGSEAALFSQVRLGAVNFIHINPGSLASIAPTADISGVGFVFKDEDEGLRVHGGPLGDYIRAEALSKGLYVCRTFWSAGMLQISSSSHPIRKPDDLHGFKIRVAGGKIQLDLFKTLGASPVGISVNEAYTAMQTKLVDGGASPLPSIAAGRIYEVQKYISLTNHQWSGFWLVGNGDTWKSLPPDLQAIVERNGARYALLAERDAKASKTSLIAKMTQQGIIFNQVDQAPFRPLLRSYYDTWARDFGAKPWGYLQSSLGRRIG